MNGDEYALTDEQKTAMQEVRNLLGNDASAALAHQELMKTKPDLFKNIGQDAHLVMYNWAGFKKVEESAQQPESTSEQST